MTTPIVVVGAGLAGLAAALRLAEAGRAVHLLEQSDGVGGRVRTDAHEGFLLDRGFQVLLDAYPEARAQFNYEALKLEPFFPGALVRSRGAFHAVADPFRAPLAALASLASPIGTLADKLRVLVLRQRACRGTLAELFARPERSTREALRALGFSSAMITRFFEPFLGGIFLGRDLQTSSRMLEFVFRMMAEGGTSLPARGMGALSAQLADRLPPGTLRLGARVVELDDQSVRLDDGSRIDAAAVIVATEGDVASRLLRGIIPVPESRSCTTVYFDAPRSPVRARRLVLNADGGRINSLAVPSDLSPTYAPAGRALVSVTLLELPSEGDAALAALVQSELATWFGRAEVEAWRPLRVYRIRWGQPEQRPPALEPVARPTQLGPTLFVAGDHRETASIHGALVSGRRAADAVLAVSA